MRGLIFYIIIAIGVFEGVAQARHISSVAELQDKLCDFKEYAASADYRILMPSADNEIVYNVNLYSVSAQDTISVCDYQISWALENSDVTSQNVFSSSDKEPSGCAKNQLLETYFRSLLPSYIATEIEKFATDSTYKHIFINEINYFGDRVVRIDATKIVNSYNAEEVSYTFNAITGAPLHIEIKRNPGTAAELLISVDYQNR